MAAREIKRANPGDLEPLLRLQEAFCKTLDLAFDPEARRAAVAALLVNRELGGVWLALEGAQAVGYLVLGYGFSLELGGRDAFVDELFVSPDSRGRGFAKALLERAVEDGASAECGPSTWKSKTRTPPRGLSMRSSASNCAATA